ncbi:MAG: transcription antitermination factor NusB [Planctomycetota bacterium]|jgi:transcription antitermination factor NusB
MLRKRTLGRELALKFLFSIDLMKSTSIETFDQFATDQEKNIEAREFAMRLSKGVLRDRKALITTIEAATRNWTWVRMPVVDRCLLLLGSYELVSCGDIPATVTINEIVDLAKKFSTAASGAFVNGVLDTINQEHSES